MYEDVEEEQAELKRAKTLKTRRSSLLLLPSDPEVKNGLFSSSAPNWNEAFISFLSSSLEHQNFFKNDLMRGAWAGMDAFVALFEEEVKETVTRLVEEIDLPDEEKSIKPCDVGGLAGGVKYVHNNLFYKFAIDVNGIFDSDDQLIGKAMGKELKNVGHLCDLVFSRRSVEQGKIVILPPVIDRVFLPFSVICDYKQYRVMASTLAPIGAETLRYGSSDGGKHVVSHSDFEIDGKAQEVAEKLCLKKHNVSNSKIWLAGDVEIHRGTDQRIWMIDLQRLLPPFSPKQRHSILTQFFPLKFMQEYCDRSKISISADVFSGFNRTKTRREDNEEAKRMEIYYFDRHLRSLCKFWERFPETDFTEIGENFCKRHLGLLLDHLRNKALREEVEYQMVFRTVKVQSRKLNVGQLKIFFEKIFVNNELQELESCVTEKYGFCLPRSNLERSLGIVFEHLHLIGVAYQNNEIVYFPRVKTIKSLTKLTEQENPLLRSETLKVSNLNDRVARFRTGFLKLFEGNDFDTEKISAMLEKAVNKNYLVGS